MPPTKKPPTDPPAKSTLPADIAEARRRKRQATDTDASTSSRMPIDLTATRAKTRNATQGKRLKSNTAASPRAHYPRTRLPTSTRSRASTPVLPQAPILPPTLPQTPPAPPQIALRRQGVRLTATQKEAAQDLFIEEFRQLGNVTAACRRAGIDRRTFYRWKEEDGEFLVLYKYAEEQANDILELAARQRAVTGVERVVVSMGKVVYVPDGAGGEKPLTQREYSDAILLRLLQAHNPKFRQHAHVDLTSGGEQLTTVSALVADLLRTPLGEQDALDALHTVASHKSAQQPSKSDEHRAPRS